MDGSNEEGKPGTYTLRWLEYSATVGAQHQWLPTIRESVRQYILLTKIVTTGKHL